MALHAGESGHQSFQKVQPQLQTHFLPGKCDFVDHLDRINPVDSVVLVDPEYIFLILLYRLL
uniref:Uncharacterized protein n=1 Tax=Pseudonaja textilis TaxID=8673 RepID=A0A670Y0W8_PSETE